MRQCLQYVNSLPAERDCSCCMRWLLRSLHYRKRAQAQSLYGYTRKPCFSTHCGRFTRVRPLSPAFYHGAVTFELVAPLVGTVRGVSPVTVARGVEEVIVQGLDWRDRAASHYDEEFRARPGVEIVRFPWRFIGVRMSAQGPWPHQSAAGFIKN